MNTMQAGVGTPEFSEDYKFCQYCGKKLKWDKELLGYDPYTGEPRYRKIYGCSVNRLEDLSTHYYWWEKV